MNIIEKLGITPGPWGIVDDYNVREEDTVQNGSIYAHGMFIAKMEDQETYKRDATIIAAAPEMLEALIEIICDAEGGEYNMDCANEKYIVEKATGRTWKEIKELNNE